MTQKLPYLPGGLLHEKRLFLCFLKKTPNPLFPILWHNKNRLISYCAEYNGKDQKIQVILYRLLGCSTIKKAKSPIQKHENKGMDSLFMK